MTTADVEAKLRHFRRWLGSVVDADKVHGFQCVDVVRQWLHEAAGLPTGGAFGNAIDYWNKPVAAVLAATDKVQTTSVKAGDIVVFRGLAGNSYGHIGVATGAQSATAVEVIEQNGSTGNGMGKGNDRIRLRSITKTRIAGVLRLKTTAPTPTTDWVILPGNNDTWRLYPEGLAPRKGNEKAMLKPSKFGGLSYPVLRYADGGNTAVIQTQQFGIGKVWIAKDTNARIEKR